MNFSNKPLTNLERDVLLSIQKYYPLSGSEIGVVYTTLGSFDMTIKCIEYATSYAISYVDAAREIKIVVGKFKP